MKAILKVIALALVVGMTTVACKKKNEPIKPMEEPKVQTDAPTKPSETPKQNDAPKQNDTPPANQATNYLVGKTFESGKTPDVPPFTYYSFEHLIFTSTTQGVTTHSSKFDGGVSNDAKADFTYTYQDGKLVITRGKLKYTRAGTINGEKKVIEETERDEDYNRKNKIMTFIVDEKAGTLTEHNPKPGTLPKVLTLKK